MHHGEYYNLFQFYPFLVKSFLSFFVLSFCLRFVTKLINASIFNKIGKLEWFFLNSSFILKISPFLAPMLRYRNSISNLFNLYQKKRVRSCHVPVFYKVWSGRFHFKIKNTNSLYLLFFLF